MLEEAKVTTPMRFTASTGPPRPPQRQPFSPTKFSGREYRPENSYSLPDIEVMQITDGGNDKEGRLKAELRTGAECERWVSVWR